MGKLNMAKKALQVTANDVDAARRHIEATIESQREDNEKRAAKRKAKAQKRVAVLKKVGAKSFRIAKGTIETFKRIRNESEAAKLERLRRELGMELDRENGEPSGESSSEEETSSDDVDWMSDSDT